MVNTLHKEIKIIKIFCRVSKCKYMAIFLLICWSKLQSNLYADDNYSEQNTETCLFLLARGKIKIPN